MLLEDQIFQIHDNDLLIPICVNKLPGARCHGRKLNVNCFMDAIYITKINYKKLHWHSLESELSD